MKENKLYKIFRQFFSILIFLSYSSFTFSSDKAQTEQVQAQLVASVEAVRPGAEIILGVNQKIIPHWHTYWVNPGDSGNATTIEWTLPEGATAGDIIWPIPQRFSMGPITNYAYENDVTLLTKIELPETIEVGKNIVISALVDWLVCSEECIPQQVELSLELPVVTAEDAVGNSHPFITEALGRLPVESNWEITATETVSDNDRKELKLKIDIPQEQIANIQDIWFYPYEWGRIQQSSQQTRIDLNNAVELTIKAGEAPYKTGESVSGVLVIKEKSGENLTIARGFEIRTDLKSSNVQNSGEESISFITAILLAFIGGIILNLMPCVFPVLSIKALSLVSHAAHSPRQLRLQGLVYTLGVVSSFLLLALLLIILKTGGAQIGWGFQFQSPVFVLVVSYLVFAVGLSLSGVFFLGGSAAGVGTSLTTKPGYSGSFFTGVLATIVATPCTAPFMAAALGYALTQPAFQLIIIFISLGLGLALPYLLLTSWPGLHRHLPQPGVWMERLKQFLAFPMYATAIWLVWVLVQQTGVDAVIYAAGGMLLIALAAWIYDSSQTASNKKRILGSITALIIIVLVLIIGYQAINNHQQTNNLEKKGDNWEAFSNERLQFLLKENKPVFLNFTASWCISCLVNERVALSDAAVVKHFKDSNITYLKGDWTNRDQEITDFLKKFNRSGVPLYVFYPANKSDQPVVLPQILTPDAVIKATEESNSN
jgi:thiol:disulfide interchange protein